MHRGLIILVALLLFNPQVQNAFGEVNPAKPDKNLIRKIKSADALVAFWKFKLKNSLRTYEN